MANKLVGSGTTIAWDSTGGSSFVPLATIIDGDKTEASWEFSPTTLLSEKAATCAKTEYDPGTMKLTLAYFPGGTEYESLKTSFLALNSAAPQWQFTFTNDGEGNGSGLTTDSFHAHIGKLGREIKKKSFLTCEIELKLTGGI